MASIAEALVATAVGLAVAIPAVAAFNFYQRHTRAVLGNTDALTNVLLAYLSGAPKAPAVAVKGKQATPPEDD
jgi:biopolymer transport protein ExbB